MIEIYMVITSSPGGTIEHQASIQYTVNTVYHIICLLNWSIAQALPS